MTKGQLRWPKGWALKGSPLPHERQHRPRFDGSYRAGLRPVGAQFSEDGTAVFGDEDGTWRVDEKRRLWLATATWQCEGWIGINALYLRCGHQGDAERIELEMRFAAGSG